MKIIFTLLIIAMLGQVSLAAVVGRFRRDADVFGEYESMMKLMRAAADASGPIVKQTLEKLPQTDAYAKYKVELEEFLEAYNKYKNKKGLCLEKITTLFDKYNAMTDEYEKEDAPAEAKKIFEMLESFGGEKIENEIKEFVLSMAKLEQANKNKPEDNDEDTEDVMDGLKVLALMLEVC